MDRHQFVEKLIKERDETKEQLLKLKYKVRVAYSRSWAGIKEKIEEKKKDIANTSCGTYGHIPSEMLDESAKVTDEDIKKLSHQIVNLQQKVKATQIELSELLNNDAIAYIKGFLDE